VVFRFGDEQVGSDINGKERIDNKPLYRFSAMSSTKSVRCGNNSNATSA
jgi:hypothetical protein